MTGAVAIGLVVFVGALLFGRRGSRTKDGGAVPPVIVSSAPRARQHGPGRFPRHHGGL